MDDSYLEWPGRYASVMGLLSKGEQHRMPVFPTSMPMPVPFTTFGPIPSGRIYPHDDPVISLGPMPPAPIPRVPMPHVPAVMLTRPTMLRAQFAPIGPMALARPMMPNRRTSVPFVLRKTQPGDYPGLHFPFPFPHPGQHGEPLPPPDNFPRVIAREKHLVPPEPDAGRLFGSGTPGTPMLRSARSENDLHRKSLLDEKPVTKGPYTSEEIPEGPPPAPVFIDRDISDKMFSSALVKAPVVEGFGRGVPPKPFHADAEHPANLDAPPRPPHASSASEHGTGKRESFVGNETLSRRSSSPVIIPIDVDFVKHPWQKKQQLWQRPEHRFTMFGLISYLAPVKHEGEDVILPPHLPLGRLNWNILEPPSKATLIFPNGENKPLGNPELETLAVAPPRKIIYLVYEPLIGDCVMMTIRGGPAGVTVRNVLDDIWGYLQKEYSQRDIKSRLADGPDAQRSLPDHRLRSEDPMYTQRQPLYRFLLNRVSFGGIMHHEERLSKVLGSRYQSEDVWFLQFNDGPQPPPAQ